MWEPKNDMKLEQDVRDELLWDPSVDQSGIAVSAKDGIVTLSGYVPTYAMKVAAARDAERISGARAVVQHLQVQVPGPQTRSDAELAKAVVHALAPSCIGPERRRLLDLGVVPGTLIRCEFTSPFGSPRSYAIRGALIALRDHQAERILIHGT